MVKQRLNAGEPIDLYFWRDNVGNEIDVLFETPGGLQAVEIKSGATFASDWPGTILKWKTLVGNSALEPWVIFGGDGDYLRQGCRARGWKEFALVAPNEENSSPA